MMDVDFLAFDEDLPHSHICHIIFLCSVAELLAWPKEGAANDTVDACAHTAAASAISDPAGTIQSHLHAMEIEPCEGPCQDLFFQRWEGEQCLLSRSWVQLHILYSSVK